MLRIDRRLNLVIPVYEDDGAAIRAYVHSTPLAREHADLYFLILAQTFSQIWNQGLGAAAGPGVALKLLTKIAKDGGEWEDRKDGEKGVKNGLIEEIRRLTMVVIKDGSAWSPVPLQVAVDRKIINGDDQSEVENAIVFFIAVSATLNRVQRRGMIEAACGLWNAQTTSSNATEYAASLPTSIATVSSGESAPAIVDESSESANATVDGKPLSVPR